MYSAVTRGVCLSVGCLFYILGICGNALIIWTFLKTKRLRIVQNVFVVMLAIIDFHIIGILMPFTVYILISNEAPMSKAVCQMFGALAHMFFTLCLQFIMCIAISRYVKVCHGNKFYILFSPRKVCVMTITCLIYWFIFLVPIMTEEDYIIFDKGFQMCMFNRFKNQTYTTIYTFFCLFLPVTVTSICYIKLYCYIRKAKHRLCRSWNNGLARQRIMHELTVTRSQFAVFVAYLILYMPFGVSTILGENPGANWAWLNPAGYYCGLANSCINSVLYGMMNKNMREAYFEVVPCLRKKINMRIHPLLNKHSGTTATTPF